MPCLDPPNDPRCAFSLTKSSADNLVFTCSILPCVEMYVPRNYGGSIPTRTSVFASLGTGAPPSTLSGQRVLCFGNISSGSDCSFAEVADDTLNHSLVR